MPITKELENMRKFESVGFTHEQAETLTDVIEQSHVNGQENLKELIERKFEGIDRKFEGVDKKFEGIDRKFENMHHEIVNLELRIKASHTDLLMKFFAIVAGCISIGIAVARFLWR